MVEAHGNQNAICLRSRHSPCLHVGQCTIPIDTEVDCSEIEEGGKVSTLLALPFLNRVVLLAIEFSYKAFIRIDGHSWASKDDALPGSVKVVNFLRFVDGFLDGLGLDPPIPDCDIGGAFSLDKAGVNHAAQLSPRKGFGLDEGVPESLVELRIVLRSSGWVR